MENILRKHESGKNLLILLLIIISFCVSCKKDDSEEIPPTTTSSSRPLSLLRTLKWDLDKEAHFEYNADSTLKERIDKQGNLEGKTSFVWENKKMIQHHQEVSMYQNDYTYNSKNQLTSIRNRYKSLPLPNGYELKFDYHSSGQLLFMTYSKINEGGSTLQQRSFYTFNSDRSLKKVSSFNSANKLIVENIIESYSDSCDFSPWIYVSPNLHAQYHIFNYPVLSSMKKYPTRIVQKLYNPDGTINSTTIYINTPVIENYTMMKLDQEIIYPDNPTYNGSLSVDYFY